ncbi:hypothetical protein BJ170DRAFT_410759 [Xylariales sp. AK1849]|nr:hypothetical protein BJ170DRAFT_410759 [Xylariales sp. AK1849]
MEQRPLDQIRKETKAAHRAPHLRKNNIVPADTIDSLDNILGGPYHHEGPYDATLAPRNKNKKYAPVEATKEGNMAALKATPLENVQDSLRKHVPLQGTAIIPPGEEDLRGNVMEYEEGADLMREADASGGAYKRYDGIRYSPQDLKGKGEPSFEIERALADHKRSQRNSLDNNENGTGVYEMQPTRSPRKNGGAMVRQRSYSSSSNGAGPSSPVRAMASANDSGVRRSSSAGKHFDGLKRRLGSLRRKPVDA